MANVKLAILRNETEGPKCPFGLKINFACKNAGDLVNKMTPLVSIPEDLSEDEKLSIVEGNNRILKWQLPGTPCYYAGKIINMNDEVVDCTFGESTAGINNDNPHLQGSPSYAKMYGGVGLDGVYSYPLGYFTDYDTSRNLYYGTYSLQGSKEEIEELRKLAKEVMEVIRKTSNIDE